MASKRASTLDRQFVWHPFTQMKDWLRREPIVIAEGRGATLWDDRGREYLDANASIWTNLHGHQHPAIDRAVRAQLGKIAHCSALGLANEPAARLAAELVRAAKLPGSNAAPLRKVFFSDDGSTALEVALKLSYEFWRRQGVEKPRFLALEGAYHGDTLGAVSVGKIDLFHRAFGGLLFPTSKAMAPYCYRCPFNRAKPERADAREYRQCHLECVGQVEKRFVQAKQEKRRITALAVEPLLQGAAGMIPQPRTWLRQVADIARAYEAHVICDEVMTGFGRTVPPGTAGRASGWLASHAEGVVPDFAALAKGLTGGYLPMAATLTTQRVFDAFLGEYEEFKTFFHGHSFTGNPLGAAAALASAEILGSEKSVLARMRLNEELSRGLGELWASPRVGDIRQVGLAAGVELVRDWSTREPFELRERAGMRVCEAMSRRGVLTRPIGNVVVIMPPYCTTLAQVRKMIAALGESIQEVLR